MRLLLDECVPRKVKFIFDASGHECETVHDAGYSGKTNGELLAAADNNFDVLVTVDRNIKHQQNREQKDSNLDLVLSLKRH